MAFLQTKILQNYECFCVGKQWNLDSHHLKQSRPEKAWG